MWNWLRQTYIEPAGKTAQGGHGAPRPSNAVVSSRDAVESRPVTTEAPTTSPVPTPALRVHAPAPVSEPARRLRQSRLPSPSEISSCSAVALDFETASASRASPCAIGLAWIVQGRVAHSTYRLIRPPENRFDWGNIRVHGIRPHDVEQEPEFPQVWHDLAGLLNGKTLIAHNAAFDMGVLRATLSHYGLPSPQFRTVCTLAVARRAWPGLPRYGLSQVATYLGIQFRHHHALDDAEASAGIAFRASAALGLSNVDELHDALLDARPWQTEPLRAVVAQPNRGRHPAPTKDGDPNHPLFGRKIVVTGMLDAMTRNEALEAITAVGGRSVVQVSGEIDYLVTGAEPGWAKLDHARELQAAGHNLRIIDERSFLALLRWPGT